MQPSILYDHVTHGDHIHWCDLEMGSLATCETAAYSEHAVHWATDVLSFAAIGVLLLLALRPLTRAVTAGDGDSFTFVIPARRFIFGVSSKMALAR